MSKSGIPIVSDVAKAVKPLVPFASAILPFIPIPGFAGLSPLLTRSLLAGGIGGLTGGKGGFDAKRALTSGLLSYGLGSLTQGAGAAGTATDAATSAQSAEAANTAARAAQEATLASTGSQAAADNAFRQVYMDKVIPYQNPLTVNPISPTASLTENIGNVAKQTGENIMAAGKGAINLATGAPGASAAFKAGMPMALKTAAGTAFAGYTGTKTIDELNAQKAQAERILANIEGQKQADIDWAKGVMRDYPMIYQRLTEEDVRSRGLAGGGIANLAMAGGGQPRFLSGGGDGMSDSIPASIEGKQPARLADGEFVVPADVVSHIGNGSSKAGAQKLYKMMDRVRMARTGKKRQAPEVKTERYMPA